MVTESMRKDSVLFVNTLRGDLKKAFGTYKDIHAKEQVRLKHLQTHRKNKLMHDHYRKKVEPTLVERTQSSGSIIVERSPSFGPIIVDSKQKLYETAIAELQKDDDDDIMPEKLEPVETKEDKIEDTIRVIQQLPLDRDNNVSLCASNDNAALMIMPAAPTLSSPAPVSAPGIHSSTSFHRAPMTADHHSCSQCEELATGHLILSKDNFNTLYNCFKNTRQLMRQTNDITKRHEYRVQHAKLYAGIETHFDELFEEEQKEQFADLIEAIVPVAPKPPRSDKFKSHPHKKNEKDDEDDIEMGESSAKLPHMMTAPTDDENMSMMRSTSNINIARSISSSLDLVPRTYSGYASDDSQCNWSMKQDDHDLNESMEDIDNKQVDIKDLEDRVVLQQRTGIRFAEPAREGIPSLPPHSMIVDETVCKDGIVIQRPQLHGSHGPPTQTDQDNNKKAKYHNSETNKQKTTGRRQVLVLL